MRLVWLLLFAILMPALAAAAEQCPIEILATKSAAPLRSGEMPDATGWQDVTLPDDARKNLSLNEDAIWYRIDWQRKCANERDYPVAIAVQSMVMAGEIFVNDEPLWRDDRLIEPMSRSWNMPRFWRLPESLLKEGVNTLRFRVVSTEGQALGLGPVHIGEPQQVQQTFEMLTWRNRTLFTVNLIVSAVLGLFFLALWIPHRSQTAYGWYALSALCWIIFVTSVLATSPWPFTTTAMAAKFFLAALVLSIATFCMFTWRLANQYWPRLERFLWCIVALLLAALLLTPVDYMHGVHLLVAAVITLIFTANCLQMPVLAWRTRNREHILLAICLMALLFTSVHDFLLITKLIGTAIPMMPYANIAVTLCFAAIMGQRHASNVKRIEQFNAELKTTVSAAQEELATTLDREYRLELSHTRLQDRLQLAHDLHDGLGGSLLHMMASVEQSPRELQRERVLSMFKLLRDDLRQTIDSSSSEGIEAPATPREWIAPLRHRFTSLFDHFDIRGDWQVPDQWLTRPNALQCLVLTRLVEEGMTNVVRHSHAGHVALRLIQDSSNELRMEIEDDGVGFDVAAVRQSGLSVGMRSMATRIARVSGTLDVESRPGKTLLTVRFKLEDN